MHSWVIGASADAYEYWWLENHSNGTLGQFPKRSEDAPCQQLSSTPGRLSKRLLETFPETLVDELARPFVEYLHLNLTGYTYARVPNPFRTQSTAPSENELKLVDATEVASSLPLSGQLARNASFIIAWDDGNDAWPNGWENGTNLYGAYRTSRSRGSLFQSSRRHLHLSIATIHTNRRSSAARHISPLPTIPAPRSSRGSATRRTLRTPTSLTSRTLRLSPASTISGITRSIKSRRVLGHSIPSGLLVSPVQPSIGVWKRLIRRCSGPRSASLVSIGIAGTVSRYLTRNMSTLIWRW